METKKFIIKNVVGEYSFEIPNDKAEKTFEGILDCLKVKEMVMVTGEGERL